MKEKKKRFLNIELFETEKRGNKVYYEHYAIQWNGKDILYGDYAPFMDGPRWFQVLTSLHKPFENVSRQ